MAIQAISRLCRTFAVAVPLRILFEAPTVTQLAAAIERLQIAAAASPRSTTTERGVGLVEDLLL
jgi:hypothetical protein